jgi:TRAP-type uncharacterized transport system substrate-binding protein
MVGEIKLQLTLQSVMQNMMDGHHQLAMMQQHQQQHQNNGQQRTGKKGEKNPKTIGCSLVSFLPECLQLSFDHSVKDTCVTNLNWN